MGEEEAIELTGAILAADDPIERHGLDPEIALAEQVEIRNDLVKWQEAGWPAAQPPVHCVIQSPAARRLITSVEVLLSRARAGQARHVL